MKCTKNKGCTQPVRHTGPCYDRKHHALPKLQPLEVIIVVSRDPLVTRREYR